MEPEAYRSLRELQAQHWWFRGRRAVIAALLEQILPACDEPPAILEAGCGYGGNLPLLAQFGPVSGFELDARARAHAARMSDAPVVFGMLPEQPGFADRRFDLIVMFDVLEHIEEDVASLARLRAMLKKGGMIFVTVPALPWLWSKHDEIHHHKRRYSRRSLEQTLRAARLVPLKIGYFNSLLLPLAIGQRLADRLLAREARVDAMPPKVLNAMLAGIFGLERKLVGTFALPIGLSLFAVAGSADA
jgi:SAM-dependent methyltransferase